MKIHAETKETLRPIRPLYALSAQRSTADKGFPASSKPSPWTLVTFSFDLVAWYCMAPPTPDQSPDCIPLVSMTWGTRDFGYFGPDAIPGAGVIRPFFAQSPPMAALSESSGLQDDARLTNSYIPFHPDTRTPLGLLHIFVDSIEKKFSVETRCTTVLLHLSS